MKSHQKLTIKNPTQHKCALCRYSTEILGNYKQHFKSHSEDKPFKCPECPYRAKWDSAVKKHLKDVHILKSPASRPFPCSHPGCSYAAKRKTTLNTHSQIHSDVKAFLCSTLDCNFSTTEKGNLIRHTRTHTGEKPFVCQFESCSYATSRNGNLVTHTRTHTKERPYKCPEPNCEYSGTLNSHLKQHQLTHELKEGDERPSFPCPIELCEYKGKSQGHVSKHLKIHGLEKPFACSFESCEYRCKYKQSLETHLKTHSEERQYKCQLCPFRAKTRHTVTNHLKKVHSDPNLRPFKCTQPNCNYAARHKDSLRKHRVIHNGVKTYSCSFAGCDYRAHRTSHVQNHEYYIHIDEKKEKCAICDYRCKLKSQLITHIRTHTKEKPFVCKEQGCEYGAKNSGGLKQHQKRNHPHTFGQAQ